MTDAYPVHNRFQFSLRLLLLVVVAAGALIGCVVIEAGTYDLFTDSADVRRIEAAT